MKSVGAAMEEGMWRFDLRNEILFWEFRIIK